MSVIKKIGKFNGTDWAVHDIGVDASNVSISTTIAGLQNSNVESVLNKILPNTQFTSNNVLYANTDGQIVSSDISNTKLGYLANVTSDIQDQINNISGGSSINNLLDGSATGSLRTINSATEDNDYTIGDDAFASGQQTKASGAVSHTEGYKTIAQGDYSHAEGTWTFAYGSGSHAEGSTTSAKGSLSHTSGFNTVANTKSQFVIGEYNKLDTSSSTDQRGDYAFAIGNGTVNNRSNAFEVDWSGNTDQQGRATTEDMTSTEINDFLNELDLANIESESIRIASGIISRPSNNATTEVTVLDSALPSGKWLIIVWGTYASNSSGFRGLNLSFSDTTIAITANSRVPATSGSSTSLILTQVIDTENGTNIVLNGIQNSGAAINLSYQYTAVKIEKGIGLETVSPSYGTIYGMNNNITLTTSAQKIPLTTFKGSNCIAYNGGIKVNKAGVYEISGAAYFQTEFTVGDLVHLNIYVEQPNSEIGITTNMRKCIMRANPYEMIHTGTDIVELQQGAVIYLYAHNQTGARGVLSPTTSTRLTIKRIA